MPSGNSHRGRANIINFIRFDHGIATVKGEMQEIVRRDLPATWLLQYDALTMGPYVKFLKEHMPGNHEVGLWFEVNRKHCQDAGVRFKGEIPEPTNTLDTDNWDHHAQAMMPCGYTQKERVRLIDTMMKNFSHVWDRFPSSVAGWYIDSYSLKYLWENYQISASANCRDQWGTDGYSLWGAPYHGFYFPSTTNAISVGCEADHQIHVPVFRMLGNDPVNARNADLLSNGQPVQTLEPAYVGGGGNPQWVREYFDMILDEKTRPFGYLQIGQENGFQWEPMRAAYCFQLDELLRRRNAGQVIIETLGQTGRYVQEKYPETPAGFLDARINLLGEETRAIWYHSRNYRVQILYGPTRFEIVDIYRYLPMDVESNFCEPVNTWSKTFMALPLVDSFLFGSRWFLSGMKAGGKEFDERDIDIHDVQARMDDESLEVTYRNGAGIASRLIFNPDSIVVLRRSSSPASFTELVTFDPQSRWSPLQGVYRNHVVYGWNNVDYRLTIKESMPTLERDQGRIILASSTSTMENTFSMFFFPCARVCST